MNPATRDDFYWLVSAEAAPLVRLCQDQITNKTNAVRITKLLRKHTTPIRTAIILELAQLRIRARKKFPCANEMFFTRRGYEQSTGAAIAAYKAERFKQFERVADICCGIGGDLMSLANRHPDCETIGVDKDSLVCLYAQRNLAASGISGHADVVESDFSEYDLSSFDAVHLDPDRRTHGRTVQSNFFEPSLPEIFKRVKTENLAIKIAPASPEPSQLASTVEREWIGSRRECKQQIIWCGQTAARPGALTATCARRDGTIEQISVAGDEIDQTIVIANEIGQYVFEPHPTVLAAQLTDTIANRKKLARISPGIAYLTSNDPISTALLTGFKVIKVAALNTRAVASELVRLDAGHIEVKNRGAEKLLTDQFSRIRLQGSRRLTVLLTRHRKRGIAIIAERQE